MRIPYKVYKNSDRFSTGFNEIIRKYLYCPNCFTKTVELRDQPTILSFLGIGIDRSVYFCDVCNKIVNPFTLSELRDHKLKIINNE